jgi:hypothetical protein
MELRIGQPHVAASVETDPVQLELQVIVAVAGGVEHHAGGLVDLHQRRRLEARAPGQGRDQRTVEIVEIEVAPAVPLRLPDEPPAVREEHHGRAVLDPAGRPLFANDDAQRAGLRVRGDQFEDVLPAVGPVEEQLAAVGRPAHAIRVVADHIVVERLAAANVEPGGPLRRHVVDQQVHHRIGDAGLGIRLGIDGALQLGLIELQVIVGDGTLVEPIERELAAVGRPPHRGDLIELFAVDPAGRPILDPPLAAAVGGEGDLGLRGLIHQVQIAVLLVEPGAEGAVRRIGEGVLAAALRSALAASAPSRAAQGIADRRGLPGRDVVAIPLAVEGVLEAAAVGAPRCRDRAGRQRGGDLRRQLLVAGVAGHGLEPVLGRGPDLAHADPGEGSRHEETDDAVAHGDSFERIARRV